MFEPVRSRAARVEEEHVVVVRHAAPRLRPLQVDADPAAGRQRDVVAVVGAAVGSKSWQPVYVGRTLTTETGHVVLRYAGVSYDDTLLPPTITLSLPAAEKYGTPAALAAFAACAIGPVLEERLVEVLRRRRR